MVSQLQRENERLRTEGQLLRRENEHLSVEAQVLQAELRTARTKLCTSSSPKRALQQALTTIEEQHHENSLVEQQLRHSQLQV